MFSEDWELLHKPADPVHLLFTANVNINVCFYKDDQKVRTRRPQNQITPDRICCTIIYHDTFILIIDNLRTLSIFNRQRSSPIESLYLLLLKSNVCYTEFDTEEYFHMYLLKVNSLCSSLLIFYIQHSHLWCLCTQDELSVIDVTENTVTQWTLFLH